MTLEPDLVTQAFQSDAPFALLPGPVIAPMTGRTQRHQTWSRIPGVMIEMGGVQVDRAHLPRLDIDHLLAMGDATVLTAPSGRFFTGQGQRLPIGRIEPTMLHRIVPFYWPSSLTGAEGRSGSA